MPVSGRRIAASAVYSVLIVTLTLADSRVLNANGPPMGDEPLKASRGTTSAVSPLELPPVQIVATKMLPESGRVIYRYRVVNGGAFPITGIVIGLDSNVGATELTRAPVGWPEALLPDSSFQSPPGWGFEFIPTEGGEPASAEWEITSPSEAIMGGSSLSGFSVTLTAENAAYEEGHWTVYLDTDEEILYSAGIQPTGVTAAPLSSVFAKSDLRVRPNPARGSVGIQFVVPVAGTTIVDVFDVGGRRVRRVMKAERAVGTASITWDGRDDSGKEAAAGVYFVRVKTLTTLRFARVTRLH